MKEIKCGNCDKTIKVNKFADNSSLCEECKEERHKYICEECGNSFCRKTKFKKGRKIHCPDCIRSVVHVKDLNEINSILEVSTRTVSKILKRAGIGCMICGWNKATCDIHHIKEKSNGGTDDEENLIILCPNCHREYHCDGSYQELFEEKTISKVFNNWRDYYHPSN